MKKKLFLINTVFLAMLLANSASTAWAQGTLSWAKHMGGGVDRDEGLCIKTDAFGNVYTLGTFGYSADFDPGTGVFNLYSFGNKDIFISKLDASGNFVWAKQLGGNHDDQARSMVLDAAGNIYIIGSFNGTADFDPGASVFNLSTTDPYNFDPFICKLNPMGNFVWVKQLKGISPDHYGQGIGITLDSAGNIFTAGMFKGVFDFDSGMGGDTITSVGNIDIFISKLDTAGNFGWIKRIGGTGYDYAAGIATDNSENIIIAGGFAKTVDFDPGPAVYNLTAGGDENNQNLFVSKLDVNGTFSWAKKIGDDNHCSLSAVAIDETGNVYITGGYHGEMDFNPGSGIYTLSSLDTSVYYKDIFVSKLDSTGNFAWARSMGGWGDDLGTAIAVDVAGNVYTTGYFQDTVDFNPTAEVYTFAAAGNSKNIFISKLSDGGSFVWAKNISGTDYNLYNQGNSIAVDAETNIYITGEFQGTVDIDPGTNILDFTTFGGSLDQDIFVEKLYDTLSTVSVKELKNEANDLQLYPNPSTGAFKISINLDTDSRVAIDIVDITGQLIKTISSSKLKTGENLILVEESELSNGIYFVNIHNDTINRTVKLLINK